MHPRPSLLVDDFVRAQALSAKSLSLSRGGVASGLLSLAAAVGTDFAEHRVFGTILKTFKDKDPSVAASIAGQYSCMAEVLGPKESCGELLEELARDVGSALEYQSGAALYAMHELVRRGLLGNPPVFAKNPHMGTAGGPSATASEWLHLTT